MKSESDRELVATLAALAQATRLAIMRLVSRAGSDGIAAGDIARSTNTPPSTLSFHLKEMTQAGLLKARSHGRFIFYSLEEKSILAALAFLNGCIAVSHPPPPEAPTKSVRRPGTKNRRGRGGPEGTDDGQLNIFGE